MKQPQQAALRGRMSKRAGTLRLAAALAGAVLVTAVVVSEKGRTETPPANATASAPIPAPAPRIRTGAWADTLKSGQHPRLLGPREHLRALAKAKPDAYAEIKNGSQSLIAVGIVHAVEEGGAPREEIEKHLATARQNVKRGVTNIHQDSWIWLEQVALTYDFFHEFIPADERAKMVEWMNGHLTVFTSDEGAFHNSTLSKILTYLRIAYATWGENPKATEFRDYAMKRLFENKVLPVLREFGDGGGFTEAGWYARGSLWHLAQALELARRMEGYDGFAQSPRFWYDRLAYEMLQPYPGRWLYGTERFAVEGDGSYVYGGHTEYPRHIRTMLAQYYRGSRNARAVLNKRRPGSNIEAKVVDFLNEEVEQDTPLPLSEVPLAHFASGIGKVYARSDWSDDATWLRFECGDFWAAHQHFEVGNFEIFRREPLATESGEYVDYTDPHSVNWLLRSIAHNTLLVHQPGEKWEMLRDGGRNAPYANDGGQAKKFEWTTDTLEQWKAKRDTFERGDIVAFQDRPEYMYVAGDGTTAYSRSKVSSWVRQIVFLRPSHTFVILDRVRSTKPEYKKTWLLHGMNEPQVAGNRFSFTAGKGQLVGQTLLPAKPQMTKVEGYTYGGQTFNPAKSAQSQVAPRWRLEVSPPEARTDDVFLHVLSTADGTPPAARLVKNSGKEIVVAVGDSTVTFGEGVAGSLKVAGKSYPLQGLTAKAAGKTAKAK